MTRRRSTDEHTLRERRHAPIALDASRKGHPEPIMPAWLPAGRAQPLWRTHAPELSRLGLLTGLDVEALGVWCATQSLIEEAIGAGKAPGRDLLTTAPFARRQARLDPDSRSRILATPPTPKGGTDDFAHLDD